MSAWSRKLQADYIVWMGHDSFPCPSNTAVLDFLGRMKPAALALREVFRSFDSPEL